MKNYNDLIINRLNLILKSKKITQRELSSGINVAKTTINNWINKRSKIVAVGLKLIADYLQVPVGYFFGETATEVSGENILSNNIVKGNHNKVSYEIKTLEVEIERLQSRIRELEREISGNEALIAELRQRIVDKDEMIEILREKMLVVGILLYDIRKKYK